MIPKNKIIDDYDIKLPNKERDDSFIKFCKENNCKDTVDSIQKDEDGNETHLQHCIDHVEVKRSYKGEIQCWHIHYKVVL
jgi:hypothetical protein